MSFKPDLSWDGLIALGGIVTVAVGALIKMGKLEQKVNIMYDWFETVILDRDNSRTNTPAKRKTRKTRDRKFYGLKEEDDG